MNNKSYWIWHYGDYEIFHVMNVHLRREEQGYHRPPFWKINTPYASIKFRKEINSKGGYMICHINGNGHISVDDTRYIENSRIEITPGIHVVEVHVSNFGGLPAIFVESDVCPSDESWTCNHFAGNFSPVGYNTHFCRADQNPEEFPFEYKNVLPIAKEKTDDGILYDFGTELFGYLNIVGADANDAISVFYGESREEALDTNYSYITDYICGEKKYRLRQRAFRYIYIKSTSADIEVSVDYEYLPLETKGNFACDNALFNEIISVASYTFHLNCREAFLDGIKRDRWVWSGDAYQSARINRYLFADKEIEQRTKGFDVIITNKLKLNRETLGSSIPKLICVTATGYDNIDIAFCRENNIAVCNIVGYSTDSVAQLTVAMVLNLCTHIPEYTDFVNSGNYSKSNAANRLSPTYYELNGKTWGIVGFGNIGKKVATIAQSFGCNILVNKKTPVDGFNCVNLKTLFQNSDIITVHTPLNDSTINLINREMIDLMKSNAILVNVARGAVCDEQALADAILDKKIAGLGVDVYTKEPFAENHPFNKLLGLPNVCLTPHMAWGAYEARMRCITEISENIKAFKNGQKRNRVD